MVRLEVVVPATSEITGSSQQVADGPCATFFSTTFHLISTLAIQGLSVVKVKSKAGSPIIKELRKKYLPYLHTEAGDRKVGQRRASASPLETECHTCSKGETICD